MIFKVTEVNPQKFKVTLLPPITFKVTMRTGIPGPSTPRKCGFALGDDFTSGVDSLIYTVVFGTPFQDSEYAVTFGPNTPRSFTVVPGSKSETGFIISANSESAFEENEGVDWFATPYGEF